MARADPGARTTARNKRLIALVAAIALAPVVLSYLAYYAWPRDARVNYGELVPHATLPAVTGTRADGMPFAAADLRGRWIMLYEAPVPCTGACPDALYAMRQARTIQNAERERVVPVWLAMGQGALPGLVAEHPDLVVVRDAKEPPLPRGGDRIYLVDPLGNLVLAWPATPDIKAMAKDLSRLLRASAIG